MITTAGTARNIRLILEATITSHAGIAYHVEYNAQGTPPHHGFSLLNCVQGACAKRYLWVYRTR